MATPQTSGDQMKTAASFNTPNMLASDTFAIAPQKIMDFHSAKNHRNNSFSVGGGAHEAAHFAQSTHNTTGFNPMMGLSGPTGMGGFALPPIKGGEGDSSLNSI